jgi:hypothetical protein
MTAVRRVVCIENLIRFDCVAESHNVSANGGFAPQHVELVSKDKDLGFQRSSRPGQSDQGAPDQPAKIAHRERVSADSRSRSAVLGLR